MPDFIAHCLQFSFCVFLLFILLLIYDPLYYIQTQLKCNILMIKYSVELLKLLCFRTFTFNSWVATLAVRLGFNQIRTVTSFVLFVGVLESIHLCIGANTAFRNLKSPLAGDACWSKLCKFNKNVNKNTFTNQLLMFYWNVINLMPLTIHQLQLNINCTLSVFFILGHVLFV